VGYYEAAEMQRGRAEASFQRARAIVDEMVRRAGGEQLDRSPHSGPEEGSASSEHEHSHRYRLRRALLEDALRFYQGFLDEDSNVPAVRQEIGHAYKRIGDIYSMLDQDDAAERAFRAAMEIQRKLIREFPDTPDYERDLAAATKAWRELRSQTGS
jgi:hypothetical protein